MSKLIIIEGNSNDKDNTRAYMVKGEKGYSAYDLYVQHGGTLTEEEWLDEFLNAENFYNKSEVDEKNDEQDTEISNEVTARTNADNNLRDSLEAQLNTEINNRINADSNLQSQISGLASGSPLVATSTSQMTDTTKIYVNTTDGNWYYYNGSSWVSGGVYQASVNSLAVENTTAISRLLFDGILPCMNYIDNANVIDGKYYSGSVGNKPRLSSNSSYKAFKPFPIKANTWYKFKRLTIANFNWITDNDGIIVQAIERDSSDFHYFKSSQDGWCYMSINNVTDASELTVFVKDHEYNSFIEYGNIYDFIMLNESIGSVINKVNNLNLAEKVNLYVGTDKQFTTIAAAVNSISDASESKIYNIVIDDGTYNEYSIDLPDYVNLIGASGNKYNCIIQGYLQPSVSDADHRGTSTIDCTGNNTFKDISITAQNMRYAVHSESNGSNKNWKTIIDNCIIEHFGNQEIIDYRIANNLDYSNVWPSPHAWGEGSSEGAFLEATDTIFKSVENGFYVHGASNQTKPYYHKLENCQIISTSENKPAVYIDNASVGIDHNKVVLKNCFIGGRIGVVANSYKMNVEVSGCGNVPVYQRPNHVCSENDFPIFTDYMKQFKAGESISKGTFVYTTDGFTIYKANSSTNVKLICGYVIGDATTGDLVNVMTGYLQPSSQNWPETPIESGKYYSIDNNGKLTETNNIDHAVAISNNYYYKLFI